MKNKKHPQHSRMKKGYSLKTFLVCQAIIIALSVICGNILQVNEIKTNEKTREGVDSTILNIQPVEAASGGDGEINKPVVDNSPEGIIRRVAQEEGFEETEKLIRMAFCESSMNQYAYLVNKDQYKSVDRGLYGINDYWHSEVSNECAFSIECSTKEAIRIQREKGWDEWAKTTLSCMLK